MFLIFCRFLSQMSYFLLLCSSSNAIEIQSYFQDETCNDHNPMHPWSKLWYSIRMNTVSFCNSLWDWANMSIVIWIQYLLDDVIYDLCGLFILSMCFQLYFHLRHQHLIVKRLCRNVIDYGFIGMEFCGRFVKR